MSFIVLYGINISKLCEVTRLELTEAQGDTADIPTIIQLRLWSTMLS